MAIPWKHALKAGQQSDVCPALGLVSSTGLCSESPERRKQSRGESVDLPFSSYKEYKEKTRPRRDADDRKAT